MPSSKAKNACDIIDLNGTYSYSPLRSSARKAPSSEGPSDGELGEHTPSPGLRARTMLVGGNP